MSIECPICGKLWTLPSRRGKNLARARLLLGEVDAHLYAEHRDD
jgi:hypothetical protein